MGCTHTYQLVIFAEKRINGSSQYGDTSENTRFHRNFK